MENTEEYYKNLDKSLKQKLNWTITTIYTHSIRNIIIKITKEELFNKIKDINNCQFCDEKLNFFNKKTNLFSATLDRLNNEDYIDNKNTVIICHSCNSTKSDRTICQFLEDLKQIREHLIKNNQ